MNRMLTLTTCLLTCILLQGCVTNGKQEPTMNKMAAANHNSQPGNPNDDGYAYRSPSYQQGQTASPYIGK